MAGYPTLSSGYTQKLAQEAVACSVNAAIRAANACCPVAPIKIQAQSGAYLKSKLDGPCYTFIPGKASILAGTSCSGSYDACGNYIVVDRAPQLIDGISAGGISESARIAQQIDAATLSAGQRLLDPARRFEQYNPYVYPLPPCTVPVIQTPIPVPRDQECPLPAVNISGPNLVNSQPTDVVVTGLTGGDIDVTWVRGNDRSIVKFNVYINGSRVATNVSGSDIVIDTNYPVGFTGTLVVEPVATNNWRGTKSAPVNFTITI
jgi:hypothetical protein